MGRRLEVSVAGIRLSQGRCDGESVAVSLPLTEIHTIEHERSAWSAVLWLSSLITVGYLFHQLASPAL